MNEFRKEGSCNRRKNNTCPFRHDISKEEKNNKEIQDKIEEKWNRMVGKRDATKVEKTASTDVTYQLLSCMMDIRGLLMKKGRP